MTEGIDTELDPAAAGETPKAEAPEGEARDSEPDPIDALEKAEAVAQENWAKYLRATAETENLRKRAARDVENARKFGVEQFAGELLGVIDSLEMGLEAVSNATVESLLEGKQATLKLLRSALEKSGIESIDPEGEPFDPQLHEAMTMQPSETAEPGSVLAVIQKGYQLNGRLLRPARVIVASEAN
jgi:molecular chaperone GrpE